VTWSARVALTLIHAYQLGLAAFAGGACRFEPSCSVYASQAIEAHGTWRGSLLALRRLSRCHPLAAPGIDPVPPRTSRT
jgi:putative membrane protein insertion efficiency factor